MQQSRGYEYELYCARKWIYLLSKAAAAVAGSDAEPPGVAPELNPNACNPYGETVC